MMYKIKMDDELLFHPRFSEYGIQEAVLNQELNKAPSLVISLPGNHPKYDAVQKLKSIITVWQDDLRLFRGRILNLETGLYNDKTLTCEGQIAFLNDSTMRPYHYKGTVQGYLEMLLNQHNAQVDVKRQFHLGTVTVTAPDEIIEVESDDYPQTMTELQKNLLDVFGGYLLERYDGETEYLDYLDKIDIKNTQDIELGKNVLNLNNIIKGQDIVTAIIPLGKKQDNEERLTIKSINGGKDYIFNQKQVDQYGWIYKTVIHDDVTRPEELLRKGKEDLINAVTNIGTLSITAADLAAVDEGQQSFRFGRYVRVRVKPHGIDEYMLVTKMQTDLLHPDKNSLTIGLDYKTLTQKQIIDKNNAQKDLMNIFAEAGKEIEKAKSLILVLTNETHTVPTDSNGNNGDFTGCETAVIALFGSADVTKEALYTVLPSEGVIGIWDAETKTYRVENMTVDTGYVDVKAAYRDIIVTQRFQIAKAKAGANGLQGAAGRTYMLDASTLVLKKGADNVLLPAEVSFAAYYRDGSSAARTAYAGRMIIQESIDGTSYTTKYTSSTNESGKTYTPSSARVKIIKCTLYAAGGTTTALDTQSVVVVNDMDNLEIGGRNLLLGTKDLLVEPGICETTGVWERSTDENGYGIWTGKAAGSLDYIGSWTDIDGVGNPLAGRNVVWSADVKASNLVSVTSQYGLTIGIFGTNDGISWTRVKQKTYSLNTETSCFNISDYKNSEWVRVKFSAPMPLDSALTTESTVAWTTYKYAFQFYIDNVNTTGTVSFRKPKLEIGNTATDWSPAPEDSQSQIDAIYEVVGTNYTNAVQTAEGLILEAFKETVKTSDYETYKTTVDSRFEQMPDKIELSVTEAKSYTDEREAAMTEKYDNRNTWYRFDVNGATIGSEENSTNVHIDNESFEILTNMNSQLLLNAKGGVMNNLTINDGGYLKLGTFQFIPRNNGNVSLKLIK